VIPVSAPRRVRDRLLRAPDGPVPVLHRGPHALYFDLDDWCLGVVAARAVQVPCALHTRLSELPAEGEPRVAGGTLHLGDEPLRIGRVTDPQVPTLVRPHLGALRAEVGELVGAGDGLTPYGDDVLCGWLAVHRASGHATDAVDAEVRELLPRTTTLSAALLECALHGEVIPEFAAYVAALGTPAAPARAALTKVGHSSGRGLLAGARLALHRLGHEGTTAA
jgi:Protein of unknown function (DUF2877)